MAEPIIQVKRKPFDPDFYLWRLRLIVRENRDTASKVGSLKNLVLRAYEQGVMDGKNDQDYYDEY